MSYKCDARKTAVAVDIGGTKIACGLVDLDAEKMPQVHDVKKIPTEADLGGAHVLELVIQSIKDALVRAEERGEKPMGVGISSAGVVDPRSGNITFANDLMPGWGGTPLGTAVTESCGLPCAVLNDVHAHALGEARHGGGKELSSVLVVAVGTGIGGAFVNHGIIMLGAHDEAGHIGHVAALAAAGVACSCGATGHLEPVAAGPGIIREYLRLGGIDSCDDGSPVDGAEIDFRANNGDVRAQAAEELSGRALGEVLGSMCNMLDPAAIILSGSVAECGPYWQNALHAAFESQAMPPVKSTPIIKGVLGGQAPLIGAVENLFDPAYLETRNTCH